MASQKLTAESTFWKYWKKTPQVWFCVISVVERSC